MSGLSRSPFSTFSRLLRRIARSIAHTERRLRNYLSQTTPRRRASRIAGILLFACMSIGIMGDYGCESCRETLDLIFKPAVTDFILSFVGAAYSPLDRDGVTAKITGTDGSQTGIASFLGNFTAIAQPSGTYFLMLRQPDCSLTLISGTSALNGAGNANNATPDYQDSLHQLAGLKTKADVFAGGCPERTTGITSRAGVFAGVTKSGVFVMAVAAGNGSNNGVFTVTTSSDLSTSTFAPLTGFPAATALTASDLNGDGNEDLIVVNSYNATSAYVSVALGSSTGTFQAPVNYPTAGNMSVAAVVDDVTGDGKRDLVVASDDQHISILSGKGDGTFNAAQSFSAAVTGSTITSLITADLRSLGRKDIICSNGLILLNNGSGTFTPVSTTAFAGIQPPSSGIPLGLATGDLNNDGKADLVVSNGAAIYTFFGKGDGTFTPGASYPSINNSGYVTVVDLDGDGNQDIYSGLANGGLYSGDDFSNASAYALMGNGDGTFQGAPMLNTGTYTGSNLGDVNGGGIPDLITNGSINSPSPTFTVQLSNGKGAFTTASTITAPASFTGTTSGLTSPVTIQNANTTAASSYAVADVNGDGKADLVFVDNNLTALNPSNNQPITYPAPIYFVALNNGDGTFAIPVPYNFPQIAPASGFDVQLTATNLQIADFNHDGKADLIFTYNDQAGGTGTVPYYQGFVVLLGIGNGTFSTTPILTSTYSSSTAPTTALLPQVVSTTDLNADNKPDLVVINPTFSIATGAVTQLLTYIGNGDGTFKAPTTFGISANVYGTPVLADFDKDGKLDLAFLAETSSSQAELAIARGNGDGTFAAPTLANLAGGDAIRSSNLAAADFDADGKIDLAFFENSAYSGIFYGKGDGTFTSVPVSNYIVPKDLLNIAATNGGQVVAVDLNKDTKPDILAGSTVLLNLYGTPAILTPTTTAITTTTPTITAQSIITFTATVTPTPTGTPPGKVTFMDGTTTLAPATVISGVAIFGTAGLAIGSHSITAVYSGDTSSSGSTSPALAVTVNPLASTTSLQGPTSPIALGASAAFTVSILPRGPVLATGTVTIMDGATTLGTATVGGGTASFSTTSLTKGGHSITAVYSGDSFYGASTSSAVSVSVSLTPTSVAVTAPVSTITAGTSITFTSTITATSGTPTGTVTFFDGPTTLGTGTVASGVATYTTSTLTTGTHNITAVYSGDTNFSGSTSSALGITITAPITPDFTIATSPTTATVTHGNSATTTITIAALGSFNATTALKCTGVPANSLCTIAPSSVTPSGASPATPTLTLQTSIQSASLTTPRRTPLLATISLAATLPLGLLSLFAGRRRNRRYTLTLLAFAATTTLLFATGCGGGSKSTNNTPQTLTTAPGTYPLTVTATSGTLIHSTTFTVIVQ